MDATTHAHIDPEDRFHSKVLKDGVVLAGPQDICPDLVMQFGLSDLDALASLASAALEAERDLRTLIAQQECVARLDLAMEGDDEVESPQRRSA